DTTPPSLPPTTLSTVTLPLTPPSYHPLHCDTTPHLPPPTTPLQCDTTPHLPPTTLSIVTLPPTSLLPPSPL
ncbi:hypothetical protein Pcinc_041717, partial [Petrolisthes cinctipes]